jgi:uncharacterized protein (TIGR03437 family)
VAKLATVPFFSALLLAAGPPPLVVRAPDQFSGPISPGEIVILHSPNIGPAVLAGAQIDGAGNVTTELAGVRVLFDEFPAPISYVVTGEIMAVVPYEIAGRRTTQVVIEYRGQRSPPVTLDVVESSPALFTLDSTGHGQAAILNELGCCNSALNPDKRGAIATLFATGEGQTTPPGITGGVSFYGRPADYPVPRLPIHVTVGGEPAEIVWAGEAPHSIAGSLQVNFRVPANAPLGDAVPITLTIGDSSSPSDVTMAVRSASPRVVVIDPDPVTREWFKKTLAGASFDVAAARTASEALGQAKAPIDLVVLSLAVPAADRLETLRVLQAGHPQFAVAALGTALWLSPTTLKAADSFGAQAVFIKPLSARPILSRIRELLRPRPYPD